MADDTQTQLDDREREEIRAILASGFPTEVFPRADTQGDVVAIVARLRQSDGSLKTRLLIGGFTDYAVVHEGIEQPCETCMYYKVHRRWCDLPELACAVEPEWSCRLWRV